MKILVGLGGLEPPTSRLSGVRSNHLSYRPMKCFAYFARYFVAAVSLDARIHLVLLAPRSPARRVSHQKSLASKIFWLAPMVENTGFEPATPCVQGRCSPS